MPKSQPGPRAARKRIQGIQNQIAGLDLVCSGTIHVRTKACGKPGCRCADSPQDRHGPYYEWSRREDGKLVHSVISAPEAKLLQQAIGNYQRIKQLLKKWQRESIQLIRGREHPGEDRKTRSY